MIISHKNKFIYIKARKVAGTSVEIALSALCGKDDIITPIYEKDEILRMEKFNSYCRNYALDKVEELKHIEKLIMVKNEKDTAKKNELIEGLSAPPGLFHSHTTLQDLLGYDLSKITGYLLISICRNPFSILVSNAEWITFRQKYNKFDKEKREITNKEILATLIERFDQCLNIAVKSINCIKGHEIFKNKYTIRYENLTDDTNGLFAILGHEPIPLPITKKGIREKRTLSYYFNQERVNIVSSMFNEYMKLHGYTDAPDQLL